MSVIMNLFRDGPDQLIVVIEQMDSEYRCPVLQLDLLGKLHLQTGRHRMIIRLLGCCLGFGFRVSRCSAYTVS